ncbi:MAG TPA: ABC transporter permease [Gemmataceae bacterium]|nr:ABC transporter permease [Gemmataceae bacterium]
MSYYQVPLEMLLTHLKQHPERIVYVYASAGLLIVLACLVLWYFRKYFTFIFKSLSRNLIRTILASLATMVLVFVFTLIWSVLLLLDLMTTDRAKDLRAIVTERYQMPSRMPFAYASRLAEGAARPDHPEDIKPADSASWQFYGGTQDLSKMTYEDFIFLIAMDPRKLTVTFEDLEDLDPGAVPKMLENKRGVLMGRDVLKRMHKKVHDRFKIMGLIYKDIDLEFEIVGELPKGRNDGTAIMNSSYLNDAVDAYPRLHNGQKHPMADKTLSLFWMKVPDMHNFQKVADQVMTSSQFTDPFVKCETASSGVASFLEPWKDIIRGVRYGLVPAILIVIALVIANAISISVRERRTEMAVLKVLGYGPGRILALVLGEAIIVGGLSGCLSGTLTYVLVNHVMHGIPFPMMWISKFDIFIDAIWWGLVIGSVTSLAGSLMPAWSARTIKVSEVFSKVA